MNRDRNDTVFLGNRGNEAGRFAGKLLEEKEFGSKRPASFPRTLKRHCHPDQVNPEFTKDLRERDLLHCKQCTEEISVKIILTGLLREGLTSERSHQ